MSKKLLIFLPLLGVIGLVTTAPLLAANLGISSYGAKKIIDVINTGSSIMTVISIASAVVGGGVVTAGVVASAKAMVKKYGAKRAAAW